MENKAFKAVKSSPKQGNILNVTITSTSTSKALTHIREFISKKRKFYIVTPNPEIILLAQKDKNLMNAINGAVLSLPDGVGLAMASRFSELKTPNNIFVKIPLSFCQGIAVGFSLLLNRKWLLSGLNILKGREVFKDLVVLANKKKWKIFLLGGKNDEAHKTGEKLKLSYKQVKIECASGPILNNEPKPISESDINIQNDVIKKINNFKPQLLFVAFGAPKQEKWIAKWLPKLDIGGAMVVGGTFSYIAGTSKIPPEWIDRAEFEWIWRLITQPKRIIRIVNSVFVFPFRVWLEKLR